MGVKRTIIRAAASLAATAVENINIPNCRGAEAVTICCRNDVDSNALSAIDMQRKGGFGQDGYQTVQNDVTQSGDAITGQALNNTNSGATSTGRYRRYTWPVGGCPWNTLRFVITGHATLALGALSIEAYVHRRANEDDSAGGD